MSVLMPTLGDIRTHARFSGTQNWPVILSFVSQFHKRTHAHILPFAVAGNFRLKRNKCGCAQSQFTHISPHSSVSTHIRNCSGMWWMYRWALFWSQYHILEPIYCRRYIFALMWMLDAGVRAQPPLATRFHFFRSPSTEIYHNEGLNTNE